MLNSQRKLRKGVTGIVHLPDGDHGTECFQGAANGWITWRKAKRDGLELCWFCRRILEGRNSETPEVAP